MTFHPCDLEPVQITDTVHPRIRVKPMYHLLGFSSSPSIYARRIVLEKLIAAAGSLPPHHGIMVWDAYRCRECQGKLFEWMRGEVKKKYPELSDADNYETARKYMSPPSQVGDRHCPPHLSGGAVDITLCDLAGGHELEMGTPFDDCTDKAHADHYEKLTRPSPVEREIRDRRRLLSVAMLGAGFSVYDYEWWHFDLGNVFWSRKTGVPEAFGPLFGDREMP